VGISRNGIVGNAVVGGDLIGIHDGRYAHQHFCPSNLAGGEVAQQKLYASDRLIVHGFDRATVGASGGGDRALEGLLIHHQARETGMEIRRQRADGQTASAAAGGTAA